MGSDNPTPVPTQPQPLWVVLLRQRTTGDVKLFVYDHSPERGLPGELIGLLTTPSEWLPASDYTFLPKAILSPQGAGVRHLHTQYADGSVGFIGRVTSCGSASTGKNELPTYEQIKSEEDPSDDAELPELSPSPPLAPLINTVTIRTPEIGGWMVTRVIFNAKSEIVSSSSVFVPDDGHVERASKDYRRLLNLALKLDAAITSGEGHLSLSPSDETEREELLYG